MLKVFNISSNGFSNDGVVAMAKALEVNSSLLELDISYVRLCVFVNMFVTCTNSVHTSIQHTHNHVLYSSNNRCFTDGINGLAKALQVNDTLKQLKVHNCVYICSA